MRARDRRRRVVGVRRARIRPTLQAWRRAPRRATAGRRGGVGERRGRHGGGGEASGSSPVVDLNGALLRYLLRLLVSGPPLSTRASHWRTATDPRGVELAEFRRLLRGEFPRCRKRTIKLEVAVGAYEAEEQLRAFRASAFSTLDAARSGDAESGGQLATLSNAALALPATASRRRRSTRSTKMIKDRTMRLADAPQLGLGPLALSEEDVGGGAELQAMAAVKSSRRTMASPRSRRLLDVSAGVDLVRRRRAGAGHRGGGRRRRQRRRRPRGYYSTVLRTCHACP